MWIYFRFYVDDEDVVFYFVDCSQNTIYHYLNNKMKYKLVLSDFMCSSFGVICHMVISRLVYVIAVNNIFCYIPSPHRIPDYFEILI